MRVLVVGSAGQLGTDLLEIGASEGCEHEVHGEDRDRVDVTSRSSVDASLERHQPDLVINASAYTAVDRAEEEPDLAYAVNRDGPKHLAEACRDRGARLIHVSTDYVFDGTSDRPYRDDDALAPLGVYGKSKADGEEAIRLAGADAVIVRVSWLFGHSGANFVRTMRRLALERVEMRVVDDQHGRPTPSRALAEALFRVVDAAAGGAWVAGTFHFAGEPATTWHGFAEAIVAECRKHEAVVVERVVPIGSEEFPTPAERPRYSVLDGSRFDEVYGVSAPDWNASLEWVLARMRSE